MFQMMDNDRNSWQYWQDTRDLDEEVLQSPTTPHYSVADCDWQTLEGESWVLPVDPDASWLHSDLEDHDASSSGPLESIENAFPSENWEFSSQFRVELNGNAHASPESGNNFLVAGDGDAETAPDPENVGMCSRATQIPLPKRNKIDGEKNMKTGRRHRGPNWTLEENRLFLKHMEVQKGKSPWRVISDSLKAMGFVREAKACEDHWGVLLADLKKYQIHFGSDDILRDLHLWPSVGTMSRGQRSQNRLPLVFEEEWLEVIARIVKNRKSRKDYSKSRIHVAGTPSSSSCCHKSRVSAASAAPSSEIFDNLVGDGDGINELVRFLGSTDRNVTNDQIIEVMRLRLETKKVDLRLQEIERERERNGQVTEKARCPPAAHE